MEVAGQGADEQPSSFTLMYYFTCVKHFSELTVNFPAFTGAALALVLFGVVELGIINYDWMSKLISSYEQHYGSYCLTTE